MQQHHRSEKNQIDIAVAMNWLNAYEEGNTELADFYVSRFFFAGVAPQVRWPPARLVLVGMAAVMFVFCLLQITRLPVAPDWETLLTS